MAMLVEMDLTQVPALDAPSGQQTILYGPNPRLNSLIATSVICLTLSIAAIGARIFVKAYILRKIHLEDCTLISSS